MLEEIDQHDDLEVEADREGDALFLALETLVRDRPKNLLQELRSLVSRFSRSGKGEKGKGNGTQPSSVASKGVGKHQGKGHDGKGKDGKGKGKVPLFPVAPKTAPNASSQVEDSWVTVARNGKAKPAAKAREVGKARAGDWTAPVVTTVTAEALDNLQSDVKSVVALPSSPQEAELMWSILAAKESLDCLFVFNYKTQDGFAAATEHELGVTRLFQSPCISPTDFVSFKDTAFDVVTGLPKLTSLAYKFSCPPRQRLLQLFCEPRLAVALCKDGMKSKRMLV